MENNRRPDPREKGKMNGPWLPGKEPKEDENVSPESRVRAIMREDSSPVMKYIKLHGVVEEISKGDNPGKSALLKKLVGIVQEEADRGKKKDKPEPPVERPFLTTDPAIEKFLKDHPGGLITPAMRAAFERYTVAGRVEAAKERESQKPEDVLQGMLDQRAKAREEAKRKAAEEARKKAEEEKRKEAVQRVERRKKRFTIDRKDPEENKAFRVLDEMQVKEYLEGANRMLYKGRGLVLPVQGIGKDIITSYSSGYDTTYGGGFSGSRGWSSSHTSDIKFSGYVLIAAPGEEENLVEVRQIYAGFAERVGGQKKQFIINGYEKSAISESEAPGIAYMQGGSLSELESSFDYSDHFKKVKIAIDALDNPYLYSAARSSFVQRLGDIIEYKKEQMRR